MPDKTKTKATPRKTTASAVKKAPASRPAAKARPAPQAKAAPKAKLPLQAKVAPKAAPKAKAVPKAKVAPRAKGKVAPKAKLEPRTKVAPRAKPVAKARPASRSRPRPPVAARAEKVVTRPLGPDPEGFFVARVRGEDAVRDAPHPMLEGGGFDEASLVQAELDEGLGELPWSYGDDALIALPRDPRTLFIYWDHAQATLAGAFQGLDQPRAQIWLFVRGAGWERIRVVDFALESRGYYLHDLEPGRLYRAEIHVVDRHGQERLVPHLSNPMQLPPHGPSPVVDDRFVSIPWALPLPRLLGAGVPGGPFSEELRALLARLSDWARFLEGQEAGAGGGAGGGGAGGMGGRPTSRGGEGGPGGRPSSPSSPFGPFGGEGR